MSYPANPSGHSQDEGGDLPGPDRLPFTRARTQPVVHATAPVLFRAVPVYPCIAAGDLVAAGGHEKGVYLDQHPLQGYSRVDRKSTRLNSSHAKKTYAVN